MLVGFATLLRGICGGVYIKFYHRVLLFPYSLGIASFMHLHALIKFELSSICDKAFGKFFFQLRSYEASFTDTSLLQTDLEKKRPK